MLVIPYAFENLQSMIFGDRFTIDVLIQWRTRKAFELQDELKSLETRIKVKCDKIK